MALPVLNRPRRTQRWDPVRNLDDLVDRLTREWSSGAAIDRWVPLADVEETDDAYVVELELPGAVRDDVDVEIDGRVLTVSGEVREKERRGILHRRARRLGRFHHSLTLPGVLDEEHVEAELRDGVLTVRLPKSEATRRRRIQVTR